MSNPGACSPAISEPAISEAAELHERDFHAWTQDQAARLRAWPEALRPNALDIASLAEEIESMGRSQRGAAQSLVQQIILHLPKLRGHPAQEYQRRWQKEIDSLRDQIGVIFEENPSLRVRRAEIAATVWARALRIFQRDLRRDGLDPRPALAWLAEPEEACFDLDAEVLAEDWFPPPPGA
ncbi:DUF29 domain-containing protein [Siccirubricoccus phaeus]|uniref:DUF29 domain-containing protein n=1 Tax=Siccirubricoccus phaeus TaxID=2595053 RepID=UPI00165BDEEA|nr:DUF29 domain-containing protein [Siccirubricoccus phaeus]